MNAGIIIVYFGTWPEWINNYIYSCEKNEGCDFIILNDSGTVLSDSENINSIFFTIEQFNSLASEKLEMEIKLDNPYKLCDFKPAFGKIFEDFLMNYDFWGVSDVDMILGDVSKILNKIHAHKYDIISLYKDFVSAPFFLVRNNPFLNSAFEQIRDYKKYLNHKEYFGFDENNKSAGKKPVISKRLLNIMKYFIVNLLKFSLFKSRIAEIKHSLYWYLKKEETLTPVDYTEVIHTLSKEKKISPLFLDLMESDKSLNRKGIIQWKIEYRSGKLFESCMNREILIFHFLKSKNKDNFVVSKNISDDFIITPDGFSLYE